MSLGEVIASKLRTAVSPLVRSARPVAAVAREQIDHAVRGEADHVVLSGAARQALGRGPVLDQAAVSGLDAILADFSHLDDATRQRLTDFYAPVFADAPFQERVRKPMAGWVVGGKGKVAMIDAFRKVGIEAQAPSNALEQAVVDLAATRRDRWRRLAAQTGIQAPEAFRLFRGVNGDYAVEAVVQAWAEKGSQTMPVPSHALASWSLDSGIAKMFGDAKAASVIYEADIPFARTLADKWVDGGSFVALGLEQQEVVVTGARDALRIPKTQATVTYQGKTYSYADRDALALAWQQAHAG